MNRTITWLLFVALVASFAPERSEGTKYPLGFFVVFHTQMGVIVPGVPCRDRGNWDLESLRDRSHACLGKMEFRAFPKRVVHEFYPLKALITLEQVNTTE